jgi:glutamine amidotransferase
MTRLTIFDYGAGNLHSLAKALSLPGVDVRIDPDPRSAVDTDALVLPGVGAFSPAAESLGPYATLMRDRIQEGLPTLGICLGMQLLFDESEEGTGLGLGVIPGVVRRLRATRVPHIGWNEVVATSRAEDETSDVPRYGGDMTSHESKDTPSMGQMAYFANGYVCEPKDERTVLAYTTHETDRFASIVASGSAIGVQFHPEKSSTAGVAFLHQFVRRVTR